jgi:phosphatidate cytidylyltransferase
LAGPIAAVAFAALPRMTMSAIRRPRRKTTALCRGLRRRLDRIDSLCFAAPVFFHLTRFFFSTMQ